LIFLFEHFRANNFKAEAGPSSRNRKRERGQIEDDEDDVRAPIPQKREVLVEPGKYDFYWKLED